MRPKSVAAFILNTEGQLLAVSRKDDHEDFGMPGGKVEPGETLEEAICREVLEETGLKLHRIQEVFVYPCAGSDAHTFRVLAYEGVPKSLEEGLVGWMEPDRIIQPGCSFREYNLALFEHLGILGLFRLPRS